VIPYSLKFRHIKTKDYKMELVSEWTNTLMRPKYLVVRQQMLLNKSCTKTKLRSDSLAPMNKIFLLSSLTHLCSNFHVIEIHLLAQLH